MVPSHSPTPCDILAKNRLYRVSRGTHSCQHVEVVPVKMHRMRCWEVILDNNANSTVFLEVIDVPLRIVGITRIAKLCQEK